MLTASKVLGRQRLRKNTTNRRAERSLYHRATGYTYEAEEIFLVDEEIQHPNPDDPKHPIIVRTKKVLRVPIVKHLPPDTGALAFWLKNREKDRWRDKQDHEITGKGGRPIALEVASESDLINAYYARLNAIAAATVADTAETAVPAGQEGGEDD